jgi:hypothetical protein
VWFAEVVKLLLTGSVYCMVYGQRKESCCNVGVSTLLYIHIYMYDILIVSTTTLCVI